MSETKFTSGPWQVVNGTGVFTLLGAGNSDGVTAAENDGWHIADCCGGATSTDAGEDCLSVKENMANARLIAAAPDLYEALRSAVSLLEQFVSTDDPRDETIWDARKALAKAEGKSE